MAKVTLTERFIVLYPRFFYTKCCVGVFPHVSTAEALKTLKYPAVDLHTR